MNIYDIISLIDLKLYKNFEEAQCKKHNVIPLYIKKDKLNIVSSKDTINSLEYVKFQFGKEIVVHEVENSIFNNVLNHIYNFDGLPYEEFVISKAIKLGGSDIHFEPFKDGVNVRVRVNGDLIYIGKLLINSYLSILARIKLRGEMDIAKKMTPQDGKATFKINGIHYDIRISTLPVVNGEKMVLRILYSKEYDISLKKLQLLKEEYKILQKMIEVKGGIIIIVGPTGSGKSTTLYSILNSHNKDNENIVTIEDPVEIYLNGISQVAISSRGGLSFPIALRALLRQDPDIIMIGEIRDEETAKMAIHKQYDSLEV